MPRSLSIVIPAYNEAARLPASIARIRELLGDIELVVADDGSTDATADIARAAGATVMSLRENCGKGAAVRAGVHTARGERILVCDADLATPIEELAALEEALERGADIAIGSRRADTDRSDAHTSQPLARRVFGGAFHALVRRTFGLAVHDTTCGFKLFTRAAALDLFGRSQIDRFAYDVEILYLARDRWSVVEVPVAWHHVPGSRVALSRDIARTMVELARIRLRGRNIPIA